MTPTTLEPARSDVPLPHGLPTSSPEAMGIPSSAITALVNGLEQGGFDPHAIAVVRHGHVVARGWWEPYRPQDAALVYSLSKSFLSTAVGFAVAEGLLDLDAPIASYLPEIPAAGRAARIRVRDALSMTPGYETDETSPIFGPDPVAGVLAIEPEHEPGTVFTYNQPGPFLLSAALTRVTGERVCEYLRPRLFNPLGIGARWWTQVTDLDIGFSGFHGTLDDIIALGQVYLELGHLNGVPVLPDGWAQLATSAHAETVERTGNIDWQQGYGFLFWRGTHGFRGDGAYGQLCLVIPEEDLVVVILSAVEDMQPEVDVVWDTLLPALSRDALPEDPVAAASLAERLAKAELPLTLSTKHPTLGYADLESKEESWVVTFDGLTIDVGSERWHRTVIPVGDQVLPVAARGRRTPDGEWEATVVVTSSPHRLLLRARPGENVAEVRWHIPPLRSTEVKALAVPGWVAS